MNNTQRKREYQENYSREFPYQWFQYCCESLENIEGWDKMLNDTSDTRWHLHHLDEIQGDIVVSKDELKSRGEYYNLPSSKLIFLTEFEHKSLHNSCGKNPMFGKHLSEEHKKKISAALKGKMSGDKHPNFGKTGSLNPNAKRIIIDEDVYGSIEDAAIAFEKHRLTIYYWLKSGKAKYL